MAPLHRALRSALSATSASLRLTKKNNVPLLSLTIIASTPLSSSGRTAGNLGADPRGSSNTNHGSGSNGFHDDDSLNEGPRNRNDVQRDSSTTIIQDVPVRVLSAASVEGIHEPHCPDPDVHILLPGLLQLKSISERFTRLALSANPKTNTRGLVQAGNVGPCPRLELAANMHGELRLGIKTDTLKIESKWKGLNNPELDPGQVEGGEEGLREHPSTKMKEKEGEEGWAIVRVEGRDWGRVLGVGRLGGRVVACELA